MKRVIFITIFLLSFEASAEISQKSESNSSLFESLMSDITYLISPLIGKGDKNGSVGQRGGGEREKNLTTLISISSPRAESQVDSRPLQTPTNEEKKLLKKMGINIGDGKISIDTNRTKSFLESISKACKSGFNLGIEKASKEMPKEEDLGIKVESEKIEIDLNKTKNFMKKWLKAVEVFAKELNSTLEPFK